MSVKNRYPLLILWILILNSSIAWGQVGCISAHTGCLLPSVDQARSGAFQSRQWPSLLNGEQPCFESGSWPVTMNHQLSGGYAAMGCQESYPLPPGATLGGSALSCEPQVGNPFVFGNREGTSLDGRLACRGPMQNGCGRSGRFLAGFDFLWMRANFDQNVAMVIDPPIGNRLVPFDYDYTLSPRAWLGWQNMCGSGFRATYFRFYDSAPEEVATAVAGATPVYLFVYGAGGNLSRNAYADLGETLVSNHSLRLQSLDLEFTQQMHWNPMTIMAGYGIRLAEMKQHLRANGYLSSGVLEEAVTNDLSFLGAGPTVSLQAQRCLRNTPIACYGNTRGTLLIAETEQRIYEMKNSGLNELVDVANQREVLSNLELGVGLQYQKCIRSQWTLYCRAGYEAQVWWNAGGPVDSHSTVALDGIAFSMGTLY